MKPLNLPTVTLFAVACTKVEATVKALKHSMQGITYGEVLLFTHESLSLDEYGIRVVNIERLDYKGYNYFVAYKMGSYIKTDYSLLVQNDGYVLRPDKWDNRFFEYDYIGAPWPKDIHYTSEGVNVRVGNGGFSFRSKKLLDAFNTLGLPFTDKNTGFFHEDGLISNYYRKELENYGIKFAPVEIAARFSREVTCEDSVRYPFGFHNKRNIPKLFFLRPFLKKIHLEL